MQHNLENPSVKLLAAGILLRALLDRKELRQNGFITDEYGDVDGGINEDEIENFLDSDWCDKLCNVTGIRRENL